MWPPQHNISLQSDFPLTDNWYFESYWELKTIASSVFIKQTFESICQDSV